MPTEKEFYDVVGKTRGWSFTDLKVVSDPTPFDYFEVVARLIAPTTRWLDLGCGSCSGLEALVLRSKAFVGVDRSPFMVEKAREALAPGPANFRLQVGDSLTVDLEGQFGLITARHAPFDPAAVVSLLEDGGTFLTQQVEADDKQALKDAFGRRPGWDEGERNSTRYERAFRNLGLDPEVRAYLVEEFYQTEEDLLFLLQNTPIVPDFGTIPGDHETFLRYVGENRTARGIRATSSRSLLTVYKENRR